MNKQTIIISTILLLMSVAVGFALKESNQTGADDLSRKTGKIEFGGVVFNGEQEQTVLDAPQQMDSLTAKRTAGQVYSGNDNSRITVSFDAYGTKVEHRDFKNDPRILMISVETYPDGTQKAKVYSRNGETKYLPPELINRALTNKGSEIADALGLAHPVETPTVITPTESLPPVPENNKDNLNNDSPTQTESSETEIPEADSSPEPKRESDKPAPAIPESTDREPTGNNESES